MLKSSFSFLLLVLFSLVAANSGTLPPQQRVYLNKVPPDTIIVLDRGACETRCATYRLVLFEDGTVIWNGIAYVRKFGVAVAEIDVTKIKELIGDAQAVGFFNLKNGYGVSREFAMSDSFSLSDEQCTPTGHDAPEITLLISSGGQSKTVINDGGCTGPTFDKLAALEHKIDAITNSARWTR
jgi:hypothetical protein